MDSRSRPMWYSLWYLCKLLAILLCYLFRFEQRVKGGYSLFFKGSIRPHSATL